MNWRKVKVIPWPFQVFREWGVKKLPFSRDQLYMKVVPISSSSSPDLPNPLCESVELSTHCHQLGRLGEVLLRYSGIEPALLSVWSTARWAPGYPLLRIWFNKQPTISKIQKSPTHKSNDCHHFYQHWYNHAATNTTITNCHNTINQTTETKRTSYF